MSPCAGSISLFEWLNGAPQRATLAADSPKAEASFTHSKRWREVRSLLQTLRLRHGSRCHDARSVWSARSLLPLCDEITKTVRRAVHRGSSPPKMKCSHCARSISLFKRRLENWPPSHWPRSRRRQSALTKPQQLRRCHRVRLASTFRKLAPTDVGGYAVRETNWP